MSESSPTVSSPSLTVKLLVCWALEPEFDTFSLFGGRDPVFFEGLLREEEKEEELVGAFAGGSETSE